MAIHLGKMIRKNTYYSIASLLALAAVFLSCPLSLHSLQAAEQSSDEVASILTNGQWRIMEAGRMSVRVFKADGTFCSNTASLDAGASAPNQAAGGWKIDNGRVILTFSADNSMEEIFLPINTRFARLIDQHGMPMMMMRLDAPPGTPSPASPAFARPPLPIPAASPALPTAPPAAPAPAVSADDQHSASQLIQNYHNSLVFVNGNAGAGSGFIASIGNAAFLVTNVHVVAALRDAAFKTLDGTVVQGGAASLAVGEDICCMALPAGPKPFDVMQSVDTNAAIGDAVVVLGNAEGAGVVNTLMGKIVGIGPNLVEIDAPFVPGNSGSPIIHLKTGKVIGVATYVITNRYDVTTDRKLKEPVIRRFGYRLDTAKSWQAVNWPVFGAQAAEMAKVEGLTGDLYDFFRDLAENKSRITLGRHNNPIIKDRIDDWLEAKRHNHSEQDKEEADANLISFLKVACKSDITAAQRHMSYDYFVRQLAGQQQVRGEMSNAFDEILKNLR